MSAGAVAGGAEKEGEGQFKKYALLKNLGKRNPKNVLGIIQHPPPRPLLLLLLRLGHRLLRVRLLGQLHLQRVLGGGRRRTLPFNQLRPRVQGEEGSYIVTRKKYLLIASVHVINLNGF